MSMQKIVFIVQTEDSYKMHSLRGKNPLHLVINTHLAFDNVPKARATRHEISP